jgi:hypothetical protein
MPLVQPIPDPIPFDDVAAVLADAVRRVPGGPPTLVTASGRQLAAALEDAGFRVMRSAAQGEQLTL